MLEPTCPKEKNLMANVLEMYKNQNFLWDASHPLYYNKEARNRGMLKVLELYKQIYPVASLKLLKRKLENMRNTFKKELKKVEESKSTETDPNKVYVPKLWYYEHLSFLKSQKLSRPARDSLEDDSRDDEIEYEELTQEPENSSSELPAPPPQKKTKLSPKDTAEELLGLATELFNKPESEWDILAKGWALKLSRVTPEQRLFAEKIINDTLFEAQMGSLTRNGVRFLTEPQSNTRQPSQLNLN